MIFIRHSGTPHEGSTPHSGRYPWGSGEAGKQRPDNFLERVQKLESQGLSEKDIAEGMHMSIRELRARKSIASNEAREQRRAKVNELAALGYSNVRIGEELGLNESTVRSLRDISTAERKAQTKHTAELLKTEVDSKNYIDVGFGVAEGLGISRTRLDTAVQSLVDNEGYVVYNNFKVEQAGIPGQYTTLKVLCKPGTSFKDLKEHSQDISLINQRYISPTGNSLYGLQPIKNISSDRIQVVYAENGGKNKDGVIELRRGVDDLSMGASRYAQVRIGVDGTHFLKGMAIYADDLPDGIDIRFNTNKSDSGNKLDAFKKQKTLADEKTIDPDNPFGAMIKPGGQRGYLNIVNEEGDWGEWKKSLSSQMLSKQPVALAKSQLKLATDISKQEFDEIMSLTNPVVKQHLLSQYADGCDRAAVHLKAAALPRQGSYVILPLDTIKPTDIYAPKLNNGDSVVLIRYPHAGVFEIPRLRVNNNNKEAQRLFKNAQDAVGIHHSVAEQLSGADFDGDTVLVIPDNDKKIFNAPALKKLRDFDPSREYKLPPGGKVISSKQKQTQMGVISNLITDMTLQGAGQDDIIKAVRHSMVVIDAEKHELDWKKSYKDNDIENLKKKYQPKPDSDTSKKRYGGVSTLISRANSQQRVPAREVKGIDPDTGKIIFKPKEKKYTIKSTKMAEVDDARQLISKHGTAIEYVYADYANTMKAYANTARKEMVAIDIPKKSPSAAKTYASEVESLNNKLTKAVQHQPYERKAQLMANYYTRMKVLDNPSMSKEDIRKARAQTLTEMRARYAGQKKPIIDITPREWEAIQANAVSPTRLKTILNYADQDAIKQMATPRRPTGLSSSQLNLAKSMASHGYTQAEIANRLGVSASTVSKALSS